MSAGVGRRHPGVVDGGVNEAGVSSAAPDRSAVLVVTTLLLHNLSQSHHAASSVTRDVNFLRSDSRCRRYVSDLSNCTPRYLGSEQEGYVSLWLTLCSRLASLFLRWKTADAVFVVLSFSVQVWRYSLTDAMFLLSTSSTACQSPISKHDC